MNRRKFLQNAFGLAVLSTIPAPIIKAIESAPPATLSPPALPKIKRYQGKEGMLYIFNNERLLAATNMFQLTICQSPNGVCAPTRNAITGWEEHTGWLESIPGLKYWDIQTTQLKYLGNDVAQDLFMTEELHMIFAKDKMIFSGDVIVSSLNLNIPMDDCLFYDAILQGNGAITMKAHE